MIGTTHWIAGKKTGKSKSDAEKGTLFWMTFSNSAMWIKGILHMVMIGEDK